MFTVLFFVCFVCFVVALRKTLGTEQHNHWHACFLA